MSHHHSHNDANTASTEEILMEELTRSQPHDDISHVHEVSHGHVGVELAAGLEVGSMGEFPLPPMGVPQQTSPIMDVSALAAPVPLAPQETCLAKAYLPSPVLAKTPDSLRQMVGHSNVRSMSKHLLGTERRALARAADRARGKGVDCFAFLSGPRQAIPLTFLKKMTYGQLEYLDMDLRDMRLQDLLRRTGVTTQDVVVEGLQSSTVMVARGEGSSLRVANVVAALEPSTATLPLAATLESSNPELVPSVLVSDVVAQVNSEVGVLPELQQIKIGSTTNSNLDALTATEVEDGLQTLSNSHKLGFITHAQYMEQLAVWRSRAAGSPSSVSCTPLLQTLKHEVFAPMSAHLAVRCADSNGNDIEFKVGPALARVGNPDYEGDYCILKLPADKFRYGPLISTTLNRDNERIMCARAIVALQATKQGMYNELNVLEIVVVAPGRASEVAQAYFEIKGGMPDLAAQVDSSGAQRQAEADLLFDLDNLRALSVRFAHTLLHHGDVCYIPAGSLWWCTAVQPCALVTWDTYPPGKVLSQFHDSVKAHIVALREDAGERGEDGPPNSGTKRAKT